MIDIDRLNAGRTRMRTVLVAVLRKSRHGSTSVLPGPDKIPQRFAGAFERLYAM